jgi:hypothetical protein
MAIAGRLIDWIHICFFILSLFLVPFFLLLYSAMLKAKFPKRPIEFLSNNTKAVAGHTTET